MARMRRAPIGVDPELLLKDAARLIPNPARRIFLRGGASLGALAFLTGCDIVDGPSAERALMQVSYFNDRVQAWLFNPNKLAPTYPDGAVTRPFRFLSRGGCARGRQGRLQASGRRPGGEQEILDPG